MSGLASGARYGRLTIEDRLGTGGLAEVWRAVDLSNGRVVALKRFTGTALSPEGERARADVELLATHALHHHPNVVEIYGGSLTPEPHIVMEYMDGGDLGREIARAGRLSVERTIYVGLAVANALSAAAEAGITHGDVKPSNVLLSTDGAIKLGDFNVASVTGYTGGSVPGSMLVSFAYAAPEVWDGRASAASDLYALGCVLYECLAGRPPFSGSYAEVFRAHLEQAPNVDALPTDTPDGLRRLISDLLAKDPGARPSSAHEVAVRLAAIESQAAVAGSSPVLPSFGLWAVESAHPNTPWAWRVRHRQSGKVATVELFFGDGSLGDRVTRALAQNGRLVPLGAEALLEANRLLLRPGESLGAPTPPGWIFWVARDERPIEQSATRLDGTALATATERIRRLIATAATAGISLDLSPANLVVLGDGAIHVRRPGIAPAVAAEDADALATLRQVVVPGLVPLVARAASLSALADELARGDTMADVWGLPQTLAAGTILGSQAPTVNADATATRRYSIATPRSLRAPVGLAPVVPIAASAPLASSVAGVPPVPPPSYGVTTAPPPIRERSSSGPAALAVALLFALAVVMLGAIAYVLTGGLSSRPAPLPTLFAGAPPAASATPTQAPGATPAPTVPPIVVIVTTPAPVLTTPVPITAPPVTAAPVTLAPITAPPVTAVPVTAAPITAPPITPPPITPVPVNPPPSTPTPPPQPAWAVSLASSADHANNGELVTFTASASRDVTGSGLVIQIFNPDTGFIHTSCATGTTCSIGGRRQDTTDSYQARVSSPDGGNVAALSNRVTVTWSAPPAASWAVNLNASQTAAANGELVTFTATANQSVTGTGFEIQIFNPDTGFVHKTCSAGSTCVIGGRRQNATDTYQARISAPDGGNVQAQSDRVTVTWQ